MGMLFTSNVYQWDIIFTQKVYEYVNVKNNINGYHFRCSKYMNGSYFSLTLVYEKGENLAYVQTLHIMSKSAHVINAFKGYM